jgi:hypothetical protein
LLQRRRMMHHKLELSEYQPQHAQLLLPLPLLQLPPLQHVLLLQPPRQLLQKSMLKKLERKLETRQRKLLNMLLKSNKRNKMQKIQLKKQLKLLRRYKNLLKKLRKREKRKMIQRKLKIL